MVFFGGDPLRGEKRFFLAKAAIDELKLGDAILLLTARHVPQSEMPYYYRAADVMLLTSSHEGSPNSVKEALACNIPVVSVDVGDVKERIENIPGCFVCNDDKPHTISLALKASLESTSRNDLRKFVNDVDENIYIEKQIAIYWKMKADFHE